MSNKPVRIGDSEREYAVELLQDHFSAGRLEVAEFEQSMDQAFHAKTSQDLSVLFDDLPGATPVPSKRVATTPPANRTKGPTTSLGVVGVMLIVMSLVLVITSRGRLWPIMFVVPIAFGLSTSMRKRSPGQPAQLEPSPVHPTQLTAAERANIRQLIMADKPVAAIKKYRQVTGASLVEAKQFIDQYAKQLGK